MFIDGQPKLDPDRKCTASTRTTMPLWSGSLTQTKRTRKLVLKLGRYRKIPSMSIEANVRFIVIKGLTSLQRALVIMLSCLTTHMHFVFPTSIQKK